MPPQKERILNTATKRVFPVRSDKAKSLEGARIFFVSDSDILSATAISLGSTVTENLQDATHAVIPSDQELSNEQLDTVACAQAVDVPVISSSWLHRMASLEVDRHWSEIDLSEFTVAKRDSVTNRASLRDKTELRDSIVETWEFLKRESPDAIEEDEMRRAIELSMLDCAICVRSTVSTQKSSALVNQASSLDDESAEQILGLKKGASSEKIRAAFRKKAKETHPDKKGGNANDFDRIVRAYRSLMSTDQDVGLESSLWLADAKTTDQRDSDLLEHRSLVDELFTNHGADLDANIAKQQRALTALGLQAVEAGASIPDEQKMKTLKNCCFYLSLAACYLTGLDDHVLGRDVDLRKETALRLKRLIEAAVVRAHPEWGNSSKVGDNIQAFSDFLVYALDNPTIADWAVTVFDSVSGFVEIYKGKRYDALPTPDEQRSCCLTLLHVPGHYQPLLLHDFSPDIKSIPAAKRPTLEDIINALQNEHVFFVVTEG